MSKIIIHNENVSDYRAILTVSQVISDGLVSHSKGLGQYCFVTTFTDVPTNKKLIVIASRNRDTHTFKVREE